MVRNELKVPTSSLSVEQLQALWRSLDEDRSGLITAGEFGHFMRQGTQVHEVVEHGTARLQRMRKATGDLVRQERRELLKEWREESDASRAIKFEKASQLRGTWNSLPANALAKVRQSNSARAQLVKQERAERLHRHLMKKGAASPRVATEDEILNVATMLNTRMKEIFLDPQARSWYKLFNHMDDDCSGKIDYHELTDMIRNELRVPTSRLSEDVLQAIWRALDEDDSGLITHGEFGHFMMRGKHIHDVAEAGTVVMRNAKFATAQQVREEVKEMLAERREQVKAEVAARRDGARNRYSEMWGLRNQAEPTPWRSPRALIF